MMNPKDNIITRAEVLQHNTIDDCWLIIRNQVYDLTSFIRMHPGGSNILLSRAGEDATSYFTGKHGNNSAVIRQLETMKIGALPAHERIAEEAFEEPFFSELVARSYREKLYSLPGGIKNNFWVMRFINILLFFTFSFLALYGNIPLWLGALFVFLQAIISTSLFGLLAHENTHRNYPKNPVLKAILNFSWPVFWPFISQYGLRYEHNSHHVKIGDPEYDYEVAAFASFIRYSGHVTPNFFHKYQHKLAKYIYPFYANIITTIGGIRSSFWSRHNRKVALTHNLSLFVTFSYFLVIPSIIYPGNFLWYLLLYFLYQCTLFYGVYVGSAINHFVPSVITPTPEHLRNKFGYYVCQNTTNFCTDNKFWNWYTGGFNIQIEHHLIPFIPVENLQKMKPIVKELCAKYNYPYQHYDSFKDLWNAHYDYLHSMSFAVTTENILMEKANKDHYQAR